MARVWRLIVDRAPESGAWNMAVDHAIHSARAQGLVPPTLRIYTWAQPTVSLGRFQDLASVDVELCVREGIDVVRRSTGGRGVLHDDEVTYSVVGSTEDGVPRGVAASYRYVSAGLAAAYRELGMNASLTSRPRGERGSAACYLHSTHADLSLGVRKLSGSAQVWLATTVLQHGSFVISRDIAREARVFRLDEEARRALEATTATLSQRAGRSPSRQEVIDAVRWGFESELGIVLEEDRLTEDERSEADRNVRGAIAAGPGALDTGLDLGLE